jgi:hypothetical protein
MLSIILQNDIRKVPIEDEMEHIPSRVTNPEATRLDTTDSGGTNDENTPLLGLPEDLTSVSLRDTLSDESNALDLVAVAEQDLHGASQNTATGSEVDNNVDVGVLGDSLGDAGVDGEEGLLGSPVELLDVVSTEGVDHSSNRRRRASAGVVKVEHALDGTGLETVHERTGSLIEGAVSGAGGG